VYPDADTPWQEEGSRETVSPERKEGGSQETLSTQEKVVTLIQKTAPRVEVQRVSKRRLWLETEPQGLRTLFQSLKKAWPALHLSTITGLETDSGIEVIYHFEVEKVLVNLKVRLAAESLGLETICDILPVADAYERELHDVLGLEFSGRESTPPLVLPDTWPQGFYPLRKTGTKGDVGSV